MSYKQIFEVYPYACIAVIHYLKYYNIILEKDFDAKYRYTVIAPYYQRTFKCTSRSAAVRLLANSNKSYKKLIDQAIFFYLLQIKDKVDKKHFYISIYTLMYNYKSYDELKEEVDSALKKGSTYLNVSI